MLWTIAKRLYPRACEHRVTVSHPDIASNRPKFFKAAGKSFVLLQVLFFALFSYLLGSLYQQGSSIHNLKILWIDYDEGQIADAVRDAYSLLRSDGFPSLIERSASDYPSVDDLRAAVCSTEYWAALYVTPGASRNLSRTISGSPDSQYDRANALRYLWNQARYPTASDGVIAANLLALSEQARIAYVARNGGAMLAIMPPNNTVAISALASPWTLSATNIQPTTQGARAVYNTLLFVLILIQDFFYLGAINGLYVQFNVYSRLRPSRIIVVREMISTLFTMVGSLLITSVMWAFRSGWDVSGKQFALNWLVLWLFAHVNFLTIDVFTIWVPPQFVPMALISWVILNVTSIILPFDLVPPFYKWGYALPAHAAFNALMDIWSNGCNPHLDYALPVLFAYELSGALWTSLGVYKRCHAAVVAEEIAEEAIKVRVDAALKVLREGRAGQQLEQVPSKQPGAQQNDNGLTDPIRTAEKRVAEDQPAPVGLDILKGADEEEVEAESEIAQVDAQLARLNTRVSRLPTFGPSF
jgi:hypothetical protein